MEERLGKNVKLTANKIITNENLVTFYHQRHRDKMKACERQKRQVNVKETTK